MSLRELAKSQLECAQDAAQAEAQARQNMHANKARATCEAWWLAQLKSTPDSIECTSHYRTNEVFGEDRLNCRVVCDGETFEWTSHHTEWLDSYNRRNAEPYPAVRVVEEQPIITGSTKLRWVPVVSRHSHVGGLYAWDLPSLGRHFEAVDRGRAGREARKK